MMLAKKSRWINAVLMIAIVCFVTIVALLAATKLIKGTATLNIVAVGEKMPEVRVYCSDGTEYRRSTTQTSVYFCLDMACGVCTEQLPYIARMINIFADKELELSVIWTDKIPKTTLIAPEHQLTLRGNARIAPMTPYMFVVSSENIVQFAGTLNFSSLTQYILSLSLDDYTDRALQELKHLGYIKEMQNIDILFATANCFSCVEEYKKIRENKGSGTDLVVITDGEITSIDEMYDPMIFSNIFNVQSYPSHILLSLDAQKHSNKE